ncbi:MAG: hypothetical protein GXX85_02110 [Ignavibacteria bacterium]|nr:hypothetical protein [Ignavibacteria bacterium]
MKKQIKLSALLASAHNMEKHFNMPVSLKSFSKDLNQFRNPEYQDDPESLQYVRKMVIKALWTWLAVSDYYEITATIAAVKSNPKLKAFLCTLRNLAPKEHNHLFDLTKNGMPNDFAIPTPFRVMPKGAETHIRKSIYHGYGPNIKIEVRNSLMRAEDGKLTVALLNIAQNSPCEYSEKTISFTTNLTDIAKTLQKPNPYDEKTREAIWHGLTRINDCRMTLTNNRGLRTLGGIMAGANELEEDSNGDIRIHLDRDFVELLNEGYVKIDDNIYYKLSPAIANLYLFVLRYAFQQRECMDKYGNFEPISMDKLFDLAGLGNNEASSEYKRKRIRMGLITLKYKGVIRSFSISTDDKVFISMEVKNRRLSENNIEDEQ